MEEIGINSIEVELEIQRKAVEVGVRSPIPLIDITDSKTGKRFIVMERIFGKDIDQARGDINFRLPSNFNSEVFNEKIFQMVKILNKNGIHHCDLFPRNIMFDQNYEPIIIDYGLSKIAKTGEDPYVFINKFGEKIPRYKDLERLDDIKSEIDKLLKRR
jgi:tRNA A-37 threonylcarbamoyl transferase component Bud32